MALNLNLSLNSSVCLNLEEYHSYRRTCASASNKTVSLHYFIQFAARLNGVWHLQMKRFHHDCHGLPSETRITCQFLNLKKENSVKS